MLQALGISCQFPLVKCYQVFPGTLTKENVTISSHRVATLTCLQPVLINKFPEDSAAYLRNVERELFARISVWNAVAE